MINCKTAKYYLEASQYHVVDIKLIPEGSNHKVFIVTLENNRQVICKFPIQRPTELNHNASHLDTLFGGELSLDRETELYNLARLKGHVPAPEVYAHLSVEGVDFILLELMPGISFTKYLDEIGHKKSDYLNALKLLGGSFANIQKTKFKSYGNIMHHGIAPQNLLNFADRFAPIIENRLSKAYKKGALNQDEWDRLKFFFFEKLEYFKPSLELSTKPPVMVFTDMHADNYHVDSTGRPSGFFDLESSQAAPAELEFYGFRFFLFNYYDTATMKEAENAFFQGYNAEGGLYSPKTNLDHELIDYLSACRLLELTESYWEYKDGLRDLWAFKIKGVLMNYYEDGTIDYIQLSNIFREKTKQPNTPN